MDNHTIDTINIEINGDVNIYIYCNDIPKKFGKDKVYSILDQLISNANCKVKIPIY